MAVSIAALQTVGARRVTLTSEQGTFTGSIVTDNLTERSVMLEFTLESDPHCQIVIPVDGIVEVLER